MHKQLTFTSMAALAAAAAGFVLAPAASAQSPADPSPMTVQEADFTSATLVSQSSESSGSVTAYARVFADATVGGESLPVVLSAVVIMRDSGAAQRALYSFAGQAVAANEKQLAKSVSSKHGTVSVKLKTGPAQPLQAGDQGILIPATETATMRRLVKRRWVTKRVRFGIDFAAVRQDVAIEIIAGVAPAGPGLRRAMATLAADAALHMKTGLAPSGYLAPTIAPGGALVPGMVLSGSASTWSGSSTNESLTWVWERCDQSGQGCAPITGAVGSSYTLTQADVGSTIRAELTYSNADGSGGPAVSLPSGVVGS
jgi:hypothetical protein